MTPALLEPVNPLPSEQWIQSISSFLQQRAAASASEIARGVAQDVPLVRACLERLVQSVRVEAMRPVGPPKPALTKEPPPEDLVFYRWKQLDDRRYLWQVDLMQQRHPRLRELTGPLRETG